MCVCVCVAVFLLEKPSLIRRTGLHQMECKDQDFCSALEIGPPARSLLTPPPPTLIYSPLPNRSLSPSWEEILCIRPIKVSLYFSILLPLVPGSSTGKESACNAGDLG